MMGDGITRFASILLAIASSRDGVVLVDEIETGLHYSVVGRAWQAVSDAARRYNTQVFATTHSFEFMQAAYRAFANHGESPFRLHRLEQTKDGIKAINYDQETLAAAMEAEFEVR
jgi:AAA15 family ATPase/GTPase